MERVKKALMAIACVCLLFACATTGRDWEKAQSTNTVSAYETFLGQHPESDYAGDAKNRIAGLKKEQLEKAKDQLNRSLVSLVVQMAPPTEIKLDRNTNQILPFNYDKERSQDARMAKLEDLLKKGADPNAKRIKDYFPATNRSWKEGDMNRSFALAGSTGKIVSFTDEGQTLVEFCREWELTKALDVLKQHGAKE